MKFGSTGRSSRALAGWLCLLASAACAPDSVEEPELDRASRYGGLTDLVLYQRSLRAGGPFFLDRFEVTLEDWRRYLIETERSPVALARFRYWNEIPGLDEVVDQTLPVVGVSRDEAQAYALWRFGRLQRIDEWAWASSAGGSYRFPWGNAERAAWANTQELKLARLAPVGSFESGRAPAGCYDLVGNAAEWTTTPAAGVLAPERVVEDIGQFLTDAPELSRRLEWLAEQRAWSVWSRPGGLQPLAALWAVDPQRVPSWIIAGFRSPQAGLLHGEARLPLERSTVLGLRVASDPATLLRGLGAVTVPPTPAERRALREFLLRPATRSVLRAALRREPALVMGDGPVARLLREELLP